MRDSRIEAITKRTWGRDPFPFPFPQWMPLGYIDGEHHLDSHAYYPGALDRAAACGSFEVDAFFYVPTSKPPGSAISGSLVLAAQDSADVFFVPDTDVSLLTFTYSARYQAETPVSVGTIDLYTALTPSGQPQLRWNRSSLNLENIGGTGAQPYVFKPPLFCRGGEPVMVRITNALLVQLTIQTVFLGVRRIAR